MLTTLPANKPPPLPRPNARLCLKLLSRNYDSIWDQHCTVKYHSFGQNYYRGELNAFEANKLKMPPKKKPKLSTWRSRKLNKERWNTRKENETEDEKANRRAIVADSKHSWRHARDNLALALQINDGIVCSLFQV